MTRKRNNKIAIIVIASFIIYSIIYLFGFFLPPQQRAISPIDFGTAKWISESPNIYFTYIQEENTNIGKCSKIEGIIIIDGEEREIEVLFSFGGLATFTYKDDGTLIPAYFNGDIVMIDEEKCVIEVDKEKDEIFNGQYDKIVFVKNTIEVTNLK